MVHLTAGSIQQMLGSGDSICVATLQVIDSTQMDVSGASSRRFRVQVSDGVSKTTFVFTGPNADQLIPTGQVCPGAIIQVTSFSVTKTPGGRNLPVVMGFHLVSAPVAFIGNPASVNVGQQPDASAGGTVSNEVQPASSVGAPASSGYDHGAASAPSVPGQYGGSGPVVRSTAMGGGAAQMSFTPIRVLNMYTNKWTIKARVTTKGDVKSWQNDRGTGKLFSIDLLDEEGGEIRGTFFKDAVDKFYPAINVGAVYMISGGRIKVADARYSRGRAYEISFDDKTQVTPAGEDPRIGNVNFNFKGSLADVASAEPKQIIDVAGVLTKVGAATDITTKAGKSMTKREVTIADDSNTSVDMTLWNDAARNFDGMEGQVIALKGVQVSDWNGRTLGSMFSTQMQLSVAAMAHERCQAVAQWYANGGANSVNNLSSGRGSGGGGDDFKTGVGDLALRVTVGQLRNMDPNAADLTGYTRPPLDEGIHHVKATVYFIRADADRPPWYPACTGIRNSRPCMKKAVQSAETQEWTCSECGPTQIQNRWIVSMQISDHTGHQWVSLYDEHAVMLLGRTADEVASQWGSDGNQENFTAVFQNALFGEWLFTVKNKMEMVKEEQRMKTSVVKLRSVESGDGLAKENGALLKAINLFVG